MKLSGKHAIITGANRGFGFKVAEKFIAEGASVVICGRDKEETKRSVATLQKGAIPPQSVTGLALDMSAEKDVKNLVESALGIFGGRIDIVVNNAGVYGPKGLIEEVVSEEWVDAIHINLLSVFYVCKYILPHMKHQNSGKIVNLSGGGATAPLPRISAYAASKAAVVRLTETLAEECREYNIEINAVAPGALNTRLLDEVLEAGPDIVGKGFYEKALKQKETGGTPLELGADLCVYLASNESDGITGKLISAPWDRWKDLAQHREELKNSDIYTMRRIIEKDRGMNWEA